MRKVELSGLNLLLASLQADQDARDTVERAKLSRASVPCPYCGGTESHVTHTRADQRGIRRYRSCDATGCGRKFTTLETAAA